MARFNSPLDHVRIAAPCKADWEQMIGTDRVRFCGQCNLNVYNLSSMTRSDAEYLIARNEGRLCVSFYRRFDGSIITKNCPVGLRAIRRRLSSFSRAITSAVLSFLAGLGVYEALSSASVLAPQRTLGIIVRDIDPPKKITGSAVVVGQYRTPKLEMGRVRMKPNPRRAASNQIKSDPFNR